MLKVCSDGFWVWFSADQFTIFLQDHDDVIIWKQFPRCWPFLRRIHRSPVNSPHKGQWRGALMLSLIHTWRNGWVNNGEAGDLRRHRVHYDLTVMITALPLHESCEPSDCFTESQYKDGLPRYGISIIMIRRSRDRLIFIMGIPIPVSTPEDYLNKIRYNQNEK